MKINSLIQLGLFSLLLFLVHYLLSFYLLTPYFIEGIYKFHLFLWLITSIILFLLKKIHKTSPENFGKGYLVSVVLKMMAVIAFLWPIISTSSSYQKISVAHFFIVFFLYLIMEIKLLINTIKKA